MGAVSWFFTRCVGLMSACADGSVQGSDSLGHRRRQGTGAAGRQRQTYATTSKNSRQLPIAPLSSWTSPSSPLAPSLFRWSFLSGMGPVPLSPRSRQ